MSADPLLQGKYQDLTRKHLRGLLDRLFVEFTGLQFHVAWAPSFPHHWTSSILPTGHALCRRLGSARPGNRDYCRSCGLKNLDHTLRANSRGHHFNCRLGVRNYWFAIRVREVPLGIAYLQALEAGRPALAPRKAVARSATKVLSLSEFRRAGRLLRLIVRHVETLDLADLRKTDLTIAGNSVLALEREQAHLRQALQRHLPATPQLTCSPKPEPRAGKLVRGLLDYIDQNYARPLTLRHYACNLRMNAAYLSALFSQAVRRPFKAYLTELRLRKARELLADPAQNISEVANAVGYASDNRFRIAFKQATGLCPKLWRQTMQTHPPSPAASD
jgi:AraC-like DNA-binding protein